MEPRQVTQTIEIQNVVGSTDLGLELDLDNLAVDLAGADYDPERFPGLVYRQHEPKSACLVFRSGKVVATGAKGVDEVKEAIGNVIGELNALGIDVDSSPEITIQNVVSSADLDRQLNLNALAIGLGLEDVEYEPEQFPGLVYRLDEPDVVTLLFGSGKVVITGGSDESDASEAVDAVIESLDSLGLAG